jgi:glycerol uptake facilitator-like aquaporin
MGLDWRVARRANHLQKPARGIYGQSIYIDPKAEVVIVRHGSRRAPQWISEAVAAFRLGITVLGGIRFARESVPWLVGLYITAAYWFTASTSFANPAVAIARSMTNTFAGIRPADLPGFIGAEIAGAVLGLALMTWLLAPARQREV